NHNKQLQIRYINLEEHTELKQKAVEFRHAVQIAKEQNAQLKTIDHESSRTRASDQLVSCHSGNHTAEQKQAVLFHDVAHSDHKLRNGRQWSVAEHVVKDRFELRHNEDEKKRHDRYSHRHHDYRINHRGDHFVFNLRGFLLEFC